MWGSPAEGVRCPMALAGVKLQFRPRSTRKKVFFGSFSADLGGAQHGSQTALFRTREAPGSMKSQGLPPDHAPCQPTTLALGALGPTFFLAMSTLLCFRLRPRGSSLELAFLWLPVAAFSK